MPITIVIPALNEATSLPSTLASLRKLDPQPAEIVLVDGGSEDSTLAIAAAARLRTIKHAPAGRARQMNAGVRASTGDLLCFLHADTQLPVDFCALVEGLLADKKTALAGFYSIMRGPRKVRWASSFHNYIKTWYGPALCRPLTFLRGGRLLFGDQVMVCRRGDFDAIGGFDDTLKVMEEADFCLRMARAGRGRTRMINRHVWSSDRRLAKWGPVRANLRYMHVALAWGFGAKQEYLTRLYQDVR